MVEEVRIGILGSVDSGKSTLVGVLTSGILDNGRGLARGNVLKHPHEKSSGRTSDVSQKYVKVKNEENNDKVISFIDLAGHEKYLKTTISGINRCSIDYVMIVVGANMGVLRMTYEHLSLSLSLNIPTIIVISKIDIAPTNIYEKTKKDIFELIEKKTKKKRKPYIIDNIETYKSLFINGFYVEKDYVKNIPIISISSVSGIGIDLINNILQLIPIYNNYHTLKNDTEQTDFIIESTYMVKGIGLVVSGVVKIGKINKNDVLKIGPFNNEFYNVQIKSIHNNFKQFIDYLEAGQSGCLNIKIISKAPISRNKLRKGIRIMKNPRLFNKFKAEVKIMNHPTTINIGYEPTIHSECVCQTAKILDIEGKNTLRLGEKAIVLFQFMHRDEYINIGSMIIFREGKTKGIGKILEVY